MNLISFSLEKVYEIASGNLLCSILFGCGLTCVTLDLAEQWLFSGASNGNIFQVNLFSKVNSQTIITILPYAWYISLGESQLLLLVTLYLSQTSWDKLIKCSDKTVASFHRIN